MLKGGPKFCYPKCAFWDSDFKLVIKKPGPAKWLSWLRAGALCNRVAS